jgi:hemolysin III
MATFERHRRTFTLGEEIAHSVTHGVGIVLSIAGLAILVAFASRHGTARHVIGCSVFGASLVLLYTASTLYHGIPIPRARPVLQVLDHAGIYLLIAGTYTPLALAKLPAAVGWTLLAVLWTAAAVGIVCDALLRERFRPVSVALYLLMGWSALFVNGPLQKTLAPEGFQLLLAGGIAYTVGVVFYALRRFRYHHLIWHLCVMAGSILHFLAILFYVIPARA